MMSRRVYRTQRERPGRTTRIVPRWLWILPKRRNISGVSNFSVSQMRNSLRVAGPAITCDQVECHLGAVPTDVIRYAADKSTVVPRVRPLPKAPSQNTSTCANWLKIWHSAGHIALRWLNQQGVAEIPKTGRRERLEENLASVETVHPRYSAQWRLELEALMNEANSSSC